MVNFLVCVIEFIFSFLLLYLMLVYPVYIQANIDLWWAGIRLDIFHATKDTNNNIFHSKRIYLVIPIYCPSNIEICTR